MEKKPLYISIDFEDIYNDYLKRLDHGHNYKVNEILMAKSYETIKNVVNKNFQSTQLTFFVTGILAEKIPDLIKEIKKDGNEIACHHYFQENLYDISTKKFEDDLVKSINFIEKATGELPLGYRAPNFSINKDLEKYINIISKYFLYDSSIYSDCTNKEQLNKLLTNKKKLFHEYFIYIKPIKIFNNTFGRIKTGGTYFRILSKEFLKSFLIESFDKNFDPIIYLHPYDFLNEKEFWIEFKYFNKSSLFKNFLNYVRQHQWHNLGNQTVDKKLSYLSKYFFSAGNMCVKLK
tara:strand:- start:1505 stop:2377 length:873 start_codon:yes stop_codon:yes gene_type:complete